MRAQRRSSYTDAVQPNIDLKGRIARAITGVAMIMLAAVLWWRDWPASATMRWCTIILLCAIGLFQFYEAKKGWCIARACGIKTPM